MNAEIVTRNGLTESFSDEDIEIEYKNDVYGSRELVIISGNQTAITVRFDELVSIKITV